ncbi:hypothetical protein VE04_04078 [Pseudogymnoascus sp. 24MN13]|nr:hypothetical protein VE04_04078 [Pseudogymnoascus sp. 24MN13]
MRRLLADNGWNTGGWLLSLDSTQARASDGGLWRSVAADARQGSWASRSSLTGCEASIRGGDTSAGEWKITALATQPLRVALLDLLSLGAVLAVLCLVSSSQSSKEATCSYQGDTTHWQQTAVVHLIPPLGPKGTSPGAALAIFVFDTRCDRRTPADESQRFLAEASVVGIRP